MILHFADNVNKLELRRINGNYMRYFYGYNDLVWFVCTIKNSDKNNEKLKIFKRLYDPEPGINILYRDSNLRKGMIDMCLSLYKTHANMHWQDKILYHEISKKIVTLMELCKIKLEVVGQFEESE